VITVGAYGDLNTGPFFDDEMYYAGRPHADPDLLVHRVSNNQLVAASSSEDNTYELVDFTAPTAGEYSLRSSTSCPRNSVIPFGRAIRG
jgi:hypothetical protein